MAKCGAENIGRQFLRTTAKLGGNPQIMAQEPALTVNSGWYLLWAFVCMFWLVGLAICCTADPRLPWGRPLVGCYYFLEASGRLLGWLFIFPGGRGAQWAWACQRELKWTPREVSSGLQTPRHHWAPFGCARLCHSECRLFLISPSRRWVYTQLVCMILGPRGPFGGGGGGLELEPLGPAKGVGGLHDPCRPWALPSLRPHIGDEEAQ